MVSKRAALLFALVGSVGAACGSSDGSGSGAVGGTNSGGSGNASGSGGSSAGGTAGSDSGLGGTAGSGGSSDASHDASGGSTWPALWVKLLGGSGQSGADAVAAISSASVVVGGHKDGAIVLEELTTSGAETWSKTFPGGQALTGIGASGSAIALAGHAAGTIDLGGGALKSTKFVGRLGAAGSHVWSNATVGDLDPVGAGIDDSANVYVGGNGTGYFAGFAAADGSVTSQTTWTGGNGKSVHAMAVDSSGTATICGRIQGVVDFGSGPIGTGSNVPSLFVVRVTAGGSVTFAKAFSCSTQSGYPNCGGIAVTNNGDTVVSATFGPDLDFEGTLLENQGSNADIAVARLNSSGGVVWAKSFGKENSQDDEAYAVAAASDGRVAISGHYYAGMVLGDTSFIGNGLFMAELDANGEPTRARRFAPIGGAQVKPIVASMAYANDGVLVVTGTTVGTVIIDGYAYSVSDQSDGFIMALEP